MSGTTRTIDPARRPVQILDWPASDRTALERACTDGGLLEESGACANWAPTTCRSRVWTVGRYLTHVIIDEGGLADREIVADRLTPDRVQRYLDRLTNQSLSSRSIYSYVDGLCTMAQAMAGGDWQWLRKIANRLQRRATAAKPIRPDDLVCSRRLYRLGLSLIKQAENDDKLRPLLRAVRVRDGVLLAFQTAIALRLSNLVMSEIGLHLKREEDRYSVHFEAADMKTRRPHSEPLPRTLTDPLDRYIEVYRPLLLQGRASKGLWINQYGVPLSYVGLDERLAIVTRRHIKKEMRSHRFRHCKATTWVDNRPAAARAAAPLLGHTNYATSEKYYVRGQMILASCAHSELLDDMLDQARELLAVEAKARRRH